jgi:hypothetical protein
MESQNENKPVTESPSQESRSQKSSWSDFKMQSYFLIRRNLRVK